MREIFWLIWKSRLKKSILWRRLLKSGRKDEVTSALKQFFQMLRLKVDHESFAAAKANLRTQIRAFKCILALLKYCDYGRTKRS